MSTSRATVLCVGLTTLDVVHHVAGPLTWGRKGRSVGGELVAGGPSANAAVVAARLLGAAGGAAGGGARLLTAIGDGPAVGPVRADLAARRVEVIDLAPPGWPLPVASALVDVHTGERTVVSPGALGGAGVDPATCSGSNAVLAGAMDGVGAVLLDGHHPALAARVATLAAQAGVPVILDAGSWKDEIDGLLPRVGVAACSADLTPPGGPRAGDDPYGAARVLHRRGVPTVLVTDGPRPVVWSTLDGERGSVSVPRIRPLDTLGAGDVFHGALAAAMALGAAEVPATEVAVRVAAVRCRQLGARGWLTDPELDTLAAALPGAARRGAPRESRRGAPRAARRAGRRGER